MATGERIVECPECGQRAVGWAQIRALFYALHRPDPHDGLVWPQVWRCMRCRYVHSDPWPASIEFGP